MRRLALAIFFCSCSVSGADVLKSVYNPFTGKLDYINRLSSASVGGFIDFSTVGANNGSIPVYVSTNSRFEPSPYVAVSTAGLASGLAVSQATGSLQSQIYNIVSTNIVNGSIIGFVFSDAASVNAAATGDTTVSVTGLNPNDVCVILSTGLEAGLSVSVVGVPSPNNLTYRLNNPTILSINPVNQPYWYKCHRP